MGIDLSGPLRTEFERVRREYDRALKEGDYHLAREKALKCARLLRSLAENIPSQRETYLKAAGEWERAARTAERGKGSPEKGIQEGFEAHIESLISPSRVTWEDIGGLEDPKRLLMETVAIAALKRPESIRPWRGILLFGPPGTGKTLLAAAAAGSLKATFFNVSADKVLSKYYGESSKLVAALYRVALERAPSIVFIDEFDALSLSRSTEVGEASRRTLSTLLAQLDGFQSKQEERLVLTLAATNTPWDLDTAILSRFPRRIYVPLPDVPAACQILRLHLKGLDLSGLDLERLAWECSQRRFSGRDISSLCQQAIWNMVREANPHLHELSRQPLEDLKGKELKTRPLKEADFSTAFERVKATLTPEALERYRKWAEELGG